MVSNKRALLWSMVLVGLSLILVGSVWAGDASYHGELTHSDLAFDEGGGPRHFDVYEFTVDVGGVYSMVMDSADFLVSDDPMFYLFEDELDFANPFATLIEIDDDGGVNLLPLIERSLDECRTYILVVTSYVVDDVGTYNFHISGPGNIGSSGVCGSGAGPIAGNLLDGRINNNATLDVAAPVAVYCADDGTFDVYAIDANTGDGTLAFRATTEQVTTPVSENTLLSSSLGVSVYRLATGEFSIFATFPDGKPYAFLFDACPPTRTEHPF